MPALPERRHRFFYNVVLLFFIPFLIYVGAGYYFGVGAEFPELAGPLRLVFAIVVVLLVFYLVLHAASQYRDWRRTSARRLGRWLVWYIGLFFISGIGFVLASLLLFEGPDVVRETVGETIAALSTLEAAAERLLPVADYNTAIARLQKNKVDLHEEIVNVQVCGVGKSALAIITAIRQDIADFQILNGTDRSFNCKQPDQQEKVRQIAEQYDRKLEAAILQLRNSEKFTSYHIDERYQLMTELGDRLGRDRRQLTVIQSRLGNVWNFIGVSMLLYRDAVEKLETAASDYRSEYQQVAGFVGAANLSGIPSEVDVSAAQKIAAPPSLLYNLVGRSGRLWTWLYIAIALLVDGVAIYMWSCVILVVGDGKDGRTARTDGRIEGTDVRYLWPGEASRT